MLNNFNQQDLENFASSFISIEIAEKAGIYRIDSHAAAEILGRTDTAKRDRNGLMIPYFIPSDYQHPRDYNLRLDNPEMEQKSDGTTKPKRKYERPYGSKNKFYFPPEVTPEMLNDTSLPVVITEGEKKCLCLWGVATNDLTSHPKFLPLAISGVWNFRDEVKQPAANGGWEPVKRPMADFGLFQWSNRRVYLLFDADLETNYQVGLAQNALAQTLKSLMAEVYICSLPLVNTEEK
jgi:hypothetical protein